MLTDLDIDDTRRSRPIDHRHCCHNRRFDPELSWAIDWLTVAIEAGNEPESRRAVHAAIRVIERRALP